MSDNTKCPVCEGSGETSRVYVPQGSVRTLLGGGGPYYDEDGVYHHHEINTDTAVWSCSKGHRWAVRSRPPCPAGDDEGLYDVRLIT